MQTCSALTSSCPPLSGARATVQGRWALEEDEEEEDGETSNKERKRTMRRRRMTN
jgi:hypothetical protein